VNATEQELIGVAVMHPGVTGEQHLDGADFDSPQLGIIWDTIRALTAKRIQPTPATLISENANVDTSLLVECSGLGIPANAKIYADQIRAAAFRRNLDGKLARAHQLIGEGASPADVLADLTAVRPPMDKKPEAMDADDFIHQQLPAEEWIVNGLIARGDRLILTGEEGVGKSVCLRQIAVCAAAGVHPFTGDVSPVRRVLYVDLENPNRIMIRSFASIMNPLHLQSRIPLRIARFPQGMDLTKTPDRLTLRQLIADNAPDLLVIGPIYKMFVGGAAQKEEDLARAVTACLDGLREEFGFALAMEHHAPHRQQGFSNRDLRPIGSSLWLRWPEFGLGLAKGEGFDPERNRIVDVKHWRGDRDTRPWPAHLEQGSILPWIGTDRDGSMLRRSA
jgi:replicative DNA helicase